MKVLIACEFSGIVRDAFLVKGHDAWSCDLLPTEKEGPHIQDDVLKHLEDGWDLMVAHPPCTHLAVSGARWFKGKEKEQQEALDFVISLMYAPVKKICIENPISIISSKIRKPDQIIQPWMFGHGETKATCLWLKNLRRLCPTHAKDDLFLKMDTGKREQRIFRLPPSPDRWKKRSITFQGIAQAMADQWG